MCDRFVRRINSYIKPDVVFIYEEIVDADKYQQGKDIPREVRDIADKLECLSVFKQSDVFPVVVFPPANSVNAVTNPFNFDGVLILDDRVIVKPIELSIFPSLFSAFGSNCAARFECRPSFHPGAHCANFEELVIPSICEPPFWFDLVEIEHDDIKVLRQSLAMPAELGLVDCHVHTQFGYCAENMEAGRALNLAGEFGLAGVGLVEHSGQLYFDEDTFWAPAFLDEGIKTRIGFRNRAPLFFSTLDNYRDDALVGMEIDCDYAGNPVIIQSDAAKCDIKLGAIHWLKSMMRKPDYKAASEEFLFRLDRFLDSRAIDVLAHPFRLFEKWPEGIPGNVFKETIRLLAKYGVAAELNFHNGTPKEDFVVECLNAGIRLNLGSDSHNLSQIGELYPHLELLKRCGVSDFDLPHVLTDFSVKNRR